MCWSRSQERGRVSHYTANGPAAREREEGVTRPRQEQRKGRQSRGRAATCCRGPARSRPAQHPAPGLTKHV